MSITFNYNNMMSHILGQQGVDAQQLLSHQQLAKHSYATVECHRGKGMQGWMDSPYYPQDELERIKSCAQHVRDNYEYFVVLGIGGSALGIIATHTALNHLYYNELPDNKRNAPKFYCLDNVDPERMNALFDIIDLDKTMFSVISKSGSTSETMSQYLIVMDMLKAQYGDKAKEHIITVTSRTQGNLIKLSQQEGFTTFYLEDGVGGRFSMLSPVGLLPASIVGIDIDKLLEGARDIDKACQCDDMYANPALMGALLQYISLQGGKNISVMMPYADSLKYIADWYCQLWAESLGKANDMNGNVVNVGQTPVKSLGVTDQHSQVQLYVEGPYDKVVTFLEVGEYRSTVNIPNGCEQFPNVNFLCGHTLNELMNKELFATRYALTKAGRCNYTIMLDTVDAYHIGGLLYALQLMTAYMGEMLGIDTYDQPGVEAGKNATYALLGRDGYQQKAQEMADSPADQSQYTIQI